MAGVTPTEELESLGAGSTVYTFGAPDPGVLERFVNPAANFVTVNTVRAGQKVMIEAPEFTSLCPKTGQPDFATIAVEYEADAWCVESKSFKLYLMGYRNHGCFHEEVVASICRDLVRLLKPKWLTVQGQFTPRGGIRFWPMSEYVAERDGPVE